MQDEQDVVGHRRPLEVSLNRKRLQTRGDSKGGILFILSIHVDKDVHDKRNVVAPPTTAPERPGT